MRRVIQIGLSAVLFTTSAVIGTLGWYGAHVLASVTDAAHSFRDVAIAMNRPCGTAQPCGTLADVNRTLGTVRGTFGQIETAARHENAQLTTLDRQERTLFNDLHGVLGDARETIRGAQHLTQDASGLLGATQATIRDARPALASLTETSDASRELIRATQRRVDDPRIDDLITQLRGTSQNVNASTLDVSHAIHRVTDPPPCQGRWCWVLTTGKVLYSARELPQMSYWVEQLVQALHKH